MGARNYLIITGSEFLNDPDARKRYADKFDILSITKVTKIGPNCNEQEAFILDLELTPVIDIEISEDMQLFFFNRTLLADPMVRVLFDSREANTYRLIFTDTEIAYLLEMGKIIRTYQENEDYELGEKFISNILGHNVMHYKMVVDKQGGRIQVQKNYKYYEQRAYKFVDAVVAYHHVNKKLSFYADQILVSKRTLSKITKEVFGKSPKSILDGYIIEKAKEYLKQPELSIKEVGAKLGFLEINNFMTYFKKITNLTPSEFRERSQKNSRS